jgi:hypothetical protein
LFRQQFLFRHVGRDNGQALSTAPRRMSGLGR